MTVGKTKALTIQTFVSKVMSLPFNMLSKFVTAFTNCKGPKYHQRACYKFKFVFPDPKILLSGRQVMMWVQTALTLHVQEDFFF